eukprot:scaffold2353_cov167-Amphora_coffeaeformis.AAC.46
MKFRAMQWDYHAEAVQVEAENEKRRRIKKSRRDARESVNPNPLEASPSCLPRNVGTDNNDEKLSSSCASLPPLLSVSDPMPSIDTTALQAIDKEPCDPILQNASQQEPKPLLPTTQKRAAATERFDVVWNRVNRFPLLMNEPAVVAAEEEPQSMVESTTAATATTSDILSLSSSSCTRRGQQQQKPSPTETSPQRPSDTQAVPPMLQFAMQVAWALHCSTTTTSRQRLRKFLLPPSEKQPSRTACRDAQIAPRDSVVVAKSIDDQGFDIEDDEIGMDDPPEVLKDSSQQSEAFAFSHGPRDTAQHVTSPDDNAFDETTFPEEKKTGAVAEKGDEAQHTMVGKASIMDDSTQDDSQVALEENHQLAPSQYLPRDDDSNDSYWRKCFQCDDDFEPAENHDTDCGAFHTQNLSDSGNAVPTEDCNANFVEQQGDELLPHQKKSRVSFHESTRNVSSSSSQSQDDDNEIETALEEASKSIKRKPKDKKRKEKKKKKRRKTDHAAIEDQNEEEGPAENPTSNHSVSVQSGVPDTSRESAAATKGSTNVRSLMKLYEKRGAELQNSKDVRIYAQDNIPKKTKKPERLPARAVTASKKRFQTRGVPEVQTERKAGATRHPLTSTLPEDNSRQLRATFSQDSSINNSRPRVPRVSLQDRVGPEQHARAPHGASLSSDNAYPRNDDTGNQGQGFPNFYPVVQPPLPPPRQQQHLPNSVLNKVTDERLRFEKSYAGETSGNPRRNPTLVTPSGSGLRSHMSGEPCGARESLPLQAKVGPLSARNQKIQHRRQPVGQETEMRKGAQANLRTQAETFSANQPLNAKDQIFRGVPNSQLPPPPRGRHTVVNNMALPHPPGSWQERESTYLSTARRDFPPNPFDVSGAFVDASHSQDVIKVYCAERFVEFWPNVFGKLSSGRWQNECDDRLIPTQVFELLDTQLVDQCSVDIELSSKSAILLSPLSLFVDRNTCKETVIDIAALVAIGRYENLFVILVLNDNLSSSAQARSAQLQLQAATIRQNSVPPTSTHIKTATTSSLPESIAEIILAANAASDQETNILPETLGPMMTQRARFLLSMVPTLTASGAIQSLTIGGEMNGGPGAGFTDIITSERTRQQISLKATAKPSTAANVPAVSMVQLSHTARSKISVQSRVTNEST